MNDPGEHAFSPGSPLSSSDALLNNSYTIYLGEAHTDDPFSETDVAHEQNVFFEADDDGVFLTLCSVALRLAAKFSIIC